MNFDFSVNKTLFGSVDDFKICALLLQSSVKISPVKNVSPSQVRLKAEGRHLHPDSHLVQQRRARVSVVIEAWAGVTLSLYMLMYIKYILLLMIV